MEAVGPDKELKPFLVFYRWRVFSYGQGVPLGVDKVNEKFGLGLDSFLKQKP